MRNKKRDGKAIAKALNRAKKSKKRYTRLTKIQKKRLSLIDIDKFVKPITRHHNALGQHFAFWNPDELVEAIEGYFRWCEYKNKFPTIHSLALALGVDINCIYRYIHKKVDGMDESRLDAISKILSKARGICEAELEQELITGKGHSGQIFVAKARYGWNDGSGINLNFNADTMNLQKVDIKGLTTEQLTDLLLGRKNGSIDAERPNPPES